MYIPVNYPVKTGVQNIVFSTPKISCGYKNIHSFLHYVWKEHWRCLLGLPTTEDNAFIMTI